MTLYPDCLRELYLSEIFGERLLLALLVGRADESQRYKLGTLLQLETETKARLRPLLVKHGLSIVEDDLSADVANAFDQMRDVGWRNLMQGICHSVTGYLQRFEEIERAGPKEEQPILHSMVVHEKSILSFAERELADDPNSLADVIAQLQYPLPAPEQEQH